MQTVRGIELNLKESKYYYDFLGFRFFFSSKLYLEKFRDNVKEYINLEGLKITNKYKIPVILNEYLSISYYKKVEKRGFRILNIEKNKDIDHVIFNSNLL